MAKKNIQDIVEDKLTTFANMMKDIKSKEELVKTLVVYLRQKQDLIIQKSRDEELTKLKERKAELSKPYNQTISALQTMMTCIYKFGHKFENGLKEEFEKDLVQYGKQLSHIKAKKDEDEELNAVADLIKEINEDYDPTIKTLELKCEYIAFLLKTRFVDEPTQVQV